MLGIVPETVSGWLKSSFPALRVGAAGAVNADATATVEDEAEVVVSGVEALSETRSS